MADFTPGPWEYEGHPYDGWNIYTVANDSSIGGIYGDDYCKNSEANARLIAAAPDMYEALVKSSEYYEMLEEATGVEHGILKDIRTALAKARGEATEQS